MSFTIRKAKKEDMAAVFLLINELASFEKEPDAVKITISDLENDGFGTFPQFGCFVGEINSSIEGIALFYNRYSTWKGKSLHLEDLIVRENKRGIGLGTALLDEVIKHAHHLGVKRVNWEVLNWNKPAVSFYEKKGAEIMRDWNVVHLTEQGIKNYISKL